MQVSGSVPQDAFWFEWPDPTTFEEVVTATADLACKSAVDFTNRADSVTHDYALDEPELVADQLALWFELSVEIVARASEK